MTKYPWGMYAALMLLAVVEVGGTVMLIHHAAAERSWLLLAAGVSWSLMLGTSVFTCVAGAIYARPTRPVYTVDPSFIPRSRWSVASCLLLIPAFLAAIPAIGLLGADLYPELSPWHRFLMFVGVLLGVATPFLLLWYAHKAQHSDAHLALLDDGLHVRTTVGKQHFITKAQLLRTVAVIRGGVRVELHPEESPAVIINLMSYGPTPSSVLHVLVPYLIDNGAHVRSTWL
ncbi:hypothetical protein [Gordonia paraffinivorans]|uniref:hypothetical protein n=1 Tax=Gordonia paraffinivorans TaxID=175628 RepID=UPI001041A4AB|nr:hypothetical protein [Gordonia paraffinivorans]